MSFEIPPGIPREEQTIRLSSAKFESLREWGVEGTGLTAAARVTDPDGRIALVKNRWSDGWILPGGGVEPDEDPVNAARREVREETGLHATIGDLLVILEQTYVSDEDADGSNGTDEADNGFSARYLVFFARADGTIPDAERLGVAGDEIRAARWFDDLPENLHDGDLLRPYLSLSP